MHLDVYQNPSKADLPGFWWAFFPKKKLRGKKLVGETIIIATVIGIRLQLIPFLSSTTLSMFPSLSLPSLLDSVAYLRVVTASSLWKLNPPDCHALLNPVSLSLHIQSQQGKRVQRGTKLAQLRSSRNLLFLLCNKSSTSVVICTKISAFPVEGVMITLAQIHQEGDIPWLLRAEFNLKRRRIRKKGREEDIHLYRFKHHQSGNTKGNNA